MAVSPEAMLISAVLNNQDYEAALKHSVSSVMFHAYADEWEWIESYWMKYRRAPSRLAFKNAFREFRVHQVDDTSHFIEEVRKSHARNALTTVMRDCTEMIADGDIDRAVAFMTLQMNTVSAVMGATADVDIVKDWKKTYDDAEHRRERFEEFGRAGIPTGFDTLDERTGGIQPGQSWIVAARLGEKKSWTLMRMATAALVAGFDVHYTALEQTSTEVSMRVHNFLSGEVGKQVFEAQALGMGTEPDMKAYREFLRKLGTHIKSKMTISDKRGIGIPEFRAQLARHRPNVWFLDYLTLADSGGAGDWMDIGRLSKGIKELAGEYECGTVSAAQLNREAAQGKGPAGAETIGRSDSIGQDADMVITTKQLSNSINMYRLTKARNGIGGFNWYCHFDPTHGKFLEIEKQRAMDIVDQDRIDAGEE